MNLSNRTALAGIFSTVFVLATVATGQIKPPPKISYLQPLGGKRGTTFNMTIGGSAMQEEANVTNVIVSCEKFVTVKVVDVPKDEFANCEVTIADDAPLGTHALRVVSPRGSSNRFFFTIGTLDEIDETEPNNAYPEAQTISTLPTIINGSLAEAADTDFFKFPAEEGQTMAFSVRAWRLGSPLDADLVLWDANGRQIRWATDFYRADPYFQYKFKESGNYFLQVRDYNYRGDAAFVYRLKMGALPHVTALMPMGGQRGTETEVNAIGANVVDAKKKITPDANSDEDIKWVSFSTPMGESNRAPFVVGNLPESIETEPNDKLDDATRMPFPGVANGRIDKPGDEDYFVVTPEKGQTMRLEIYSRRITRPYDYTQVFTSGLDSLLTVFNSKGEQVGENDDAVNKDSRLDFSFPADGDYYLRVKDLAGHSGEAFVYRLSIAPPSTGFELWSAPDAINIGQEGDSAIVTVHASRENFSEEITVSVEGLPDGMAVPPIVIPKGQDSNIFSITTPADANLSTYKLQMVGKATIKDKAETHKVEPREMVGGDPKRTRPAVFQLLTITQPRPFVLSTESTEFVAVRDGPPVPIKVFVKRQEKAIKVIDLSLQRLPGNVTPKNGKIEKGKNEATLTIEAKENAPIIEQAFFINGVMKFGTESLTLTTPCVRLRIEPTPFTLALAYDEAEPLLQGGTWVLTVTAKRFGGFDGPIELTVDDLPEHVTAEDVQIEKGKTEGILTLSATADAAVGDTKIKVTGTADFNDEKTFTPEAISLTVAAPPK